jgi:hypothetical protein
MNYPYYLEQSPRKHELKTSLTTRFASFPTSSEIWVNRF